MNPSPLRLGTFLATGSPAVTELAAECGFDWLLLDFEHGCVSEAALPDLLRAVKGTRTEMIVRVGAPHPDAISRALDWGARGIMVPHVNSADEARACVQAMHHSPRGTRGYSRSVRAHGYGLRAPESAGDAPAPLFMAQIETLEGVGQCEAIARVEGVDVLFVGPADLQFDLKARAGQNPPPYESCLQQVVTAARTAGKASGILVRDLTELPRFAAQGFTHLAVDSDLSILRKGFQQALAAARGMAK